MLRHMPQCAPQFRQALEEGRDINVVLHSLEEELQRRGGSLGAPAGAGQDSSSSSSWGLGGSRVGVEGGEEMAKVRRGS